MVKPCEKCGNIGFVDALTVCSKCKVTCEHMYCMTEMPEEREKWVCEDCHSSNRIPSSYFAQNRQPCGARMNISLNKPPKKSKVQYIEPEVAMSLVSGGPHINSSSPGNHVPNRSPSKRPFFSKMKSFPPTTPPPKSCIKSKPLVVSSGCRDSHNSSMPSCSKEDNMQATTDGFPRQHCEDSVPTKRVTFGKLSKHGLSSDGCAQKLCLETPTAKQLPFGKLRKEASNSGHTSKLAEPISTVSSGAKISTKPPVNIDSLGTKSPITTLLDRYLPNHPADPPTWKGTFEIKNFGSVDHMQAHLPCKVHKNVYMFSRNLPKSLQFEMIPRYYSWVEMFEDDNPCELDIGLYFLPSPGHEQGCPTLVMHLDEHDLLLRSVIDKVELLIFSSKHLPEDLREINKKYFLWGICRSHHSILSPQEELMSDGVVDALASDAIVENEARGASPGNSAMKFREELTGGTEDMLEQFDRELQESFDRLAKLMQQSKANRVYKEIKTEPEL